MISKKMQDAFVDQINEELFSSYLYMSMAAWFESRNLRGMAQWMRVQAGEEHGHAMKFFDEIVERGGRVKLAEIKAPQFEWKTPIEAFQAALSHEQHITKRINDLTDMAIKEKDHASEIFLQWFVKEQVEEEANADEIVHKFGFIGEAGHGLYMLDKELGARKAD
jgi:ferritin